MREGQLDIRSATFATGVARTMFAALFGELLLHPRSDTLAERPEDAYSLFYARSAALGWLTRAVLPDRDVPDGGRPASPSGMRVAWPLLEVLDWFADCDPRLRAPVRVTLDGGPDSSVRAAAPTIAQWVQEIRQDVFVCDSFSLADDDHLILSPIPFEDERASTPHHRVTFRGSLAEWSLDALGWLAAYLADGSSRHGISTPLIFTADRSGSAGLPAG